MKASEFRGKRFGRLTVVADSGKRKGSSVLWRCRCDCGNEVLAVRHELVCGKTTSCGCVGKPAPARANDLAGQRFGKLTVEGDSGQRRGGCILWRCRCDCGGETFKTRSQLISGAAADCGCVQRPHAPTNKVEDLTGRTFGELTVLRQAQGENLSRVSWVCRCSCGNECVVTALHLKSGHTRSCGCKRHASAPNKEDLTGKRFGKLTVLREAEPDKSSKKIVWHCQCDCGNEVDVLALNLKKGATRSCGCWNREQGSTMHEHLHYQDNTCIERLERVRREGKRNKAGFRGLFLTKGGKYRASISFQKKHYTLGYFDDFNDAVQARLCAEDELQGSYLEAFSRYERHAAADPAWAKSNPFHFQALRRDGRFVISTYEG